MKKSILTLCMIGIITMSAIAQKEVLFQVKLKPNTTYTGNMEVNSVSTVDFEGNEEIIGQIQASGMSLPMEVNVEQKITTTTKIGSKKGDRAPVMITYDNIEMTQEMNGTPLPAQHNPMKGVRAFGYVEDDSRLKLDSIAGIELNDQFRASVKQMVEQMINNIEFPSEPMKVGEQFTQEVPMTVPVMGAQPLNIVIITKYTLKEIDDENATFDTDQDVKLNMDNAQGKMEASGSGGGAVVFNLKESAVTQQDAKINMNFTINTDSFTIIASGLTETSMQVEISH